MSRNSVSEHNSHNVIASGTTIKGDIICNSDIRIDGNVEGTLKSSGHVIVGDDGCFKGNMLSKDIDIWGKVEGTITSTDTLTLRNTGKLKGDMTVGTLVIEQGAEFNGTCKMGSEAQSSKTQGKEDNKTQQSKNEKK